jgi:chemotaxis protein MotB
MSRRRKQHKGGHANHERWLITYADLITLLMIFFVVMYAMSKVDVAKFMTLSQSLNQALSASNKIRLDNLGSTSLLADQHSTQGKQKGSETDQPHTYQQAPENDKQYKLEELYRQLQAYIQAHNLQDQVAIEDQIRGVQITLKDVVLYDTGSAVLKPEGVQILNGLIPFLKSVSNPIAVEGHTDNVPIRNAPYPSNWELSQARAVNVVHYLANEGVDERRMSATGYGEWHPLVPNDNAADRQINRRVNIVILRNSASESEAPFTESTSSTSSNHT